MKKLRISWNRTPPRVRYALAGVCVLWIAGIVAMFGNDGRTPPRQAMTGLVPVDDSAVAAITRSDRAVAASIEHLRAFIARAETMEEDRRFTSEGMRRLADAIESVAMRRHDREVFDDCDSLRAVAERLDSGASPSSRALEARRAFITASDALRDFRRRHHPGRDTLALPVITAATAIDAKADLLEQRSEVRTFLARSYELLDEMAEQRFAKSGRFAKSKGKS